jgi:hypothetical protein
MADEKELYDALAMLDRLEELREDLEELALNGRALDDPDVDEDLRVEAATLGVRTVADVEARMAELNAQVDLLEGPDETEGRE